MLRAVKTEGDHRQDIPCGSPGAGKFAESLLFAVGQPNKSSKLRSEL